MELCAGTLADLLSWDGDLLDFRLRCSLAMNVCDAMTLVHARGLVHYDLKTNNVLVVFHGGIPVAKVSDFGYARQVDPTTGCALAHQNCMQAYPELATAVAEGQWPAYVTTALDVFAFGNRILPSIFSGRWLAESVDSTPVSEKDFVMAVFGSCSHPDPKARPTFRALAESFASHALA